MSKTKSKGKNAIAYYRVSTNRQEFDRQKLEVLEYAQKHDYRIVRTVEYKVSAAKKRKERGIDELVEAIHEDGTPGTIIIAELSRFGRSVSEILSMVNEFVQEYGCRLIFVKENIILDSAEAESLENISNKVMVTIFALLADLEKHLIRSRIKSALAARKKAGVILGRPVGTSKLNAKEDEIRGLLELGVKQIAIAKKMECTDVTLSRWLKKKRKEWATDAKGQKK
jgi:putative DNA-invertase from lambdoid prophage Rac